MAGIAPLRDGESLPVLKTGRRKLEISLFGLVNGTGAGKWCCVEPKKNLILVRNEGFNGAMPIIENNHLHFGTKLNKDRVILLHDRLNSIME